MGKTKMYVILVKNWRDRLPGGKVYVDNVKIGFYETVCEFELARAGIQWCDPVNVVMNI